VTTLIALLLASAVAGEPGPTATLDGSTVTFAYGGHSYALTNSFVLAGSWVELHFEQPMDVGYNQLWVMAGKVKAGKPVAIDGFGMDSAFIQIQPGPEESTTRNVSSSCATTGTIVFATKPKAGSPVSGDVDVTITCSGVPELTAPFAIHGHFTDIVAK
jgi:hypothetical protein